MRNKYRIILPVFFLLSVAALAMKKFMVPFHGFFLIVVFDGLAIIFFMKAFTSEKNPDAGKGRSFNFDISSIVYAVCSIAILYKLQYWNGWERWITASGILFSIVSLLNLYSISFFFRLPEKKKNLVILLKAHLAWIYYLVVFTPVALTNPRTFHNLFNGTTFEEYVRTRYPLDEGTAMVELYKPSGESSKKCAEEYLTAALQFEKNEEYDEALKSFNKSIDLNPDNAKAVYNRGRLKLTHLEIDKEMAQSAYDDFTRALQLDSGYADAYYHRAVAYNYLYHRNRLPAHNDFLRAKTLDTAYKNDKFINEFLALPLIDSSVDTTTYIDLDKNE